MLLCAFVQFEISRFAHTATAAVYAKYMCVYYYIVLYRLISSYIGNEREKKKIKNLPVAIVQNY